MDADAVYRALAALGVGDLAPSEVYVLDYNDGRAPHWRVTAREDLGQGTIVLRLEDDGVRDLWGESVAVIVLAQPGRVLRTPPQLASQALVGDRLCDMVQQGRHWRYRGNA